MRAAHETVYIARIAAMPPFARSQPFPSMRSARPWRALLISCVCWLLLCLVMTLAISADAARAGRHYSFAKVWWDNAASYPPFILLSWLYYLHAQARPQRWSSMRSLLGIGLLSMLVYMPLWVLYANLVALWQQGRPLDLLWAHVLTQKRVHLIYDTVMALFAFLLQVGLSALLLARERERAWRREQTDNLQLRLTLLQGQLEPHFLFNTLNGISALVRASDRGSALSALSRVSELLRYALRASRAREVSVLDELQFVRDYAELQGLRLGAGLQMHWQVAEDAWEAYTCPPLLFQPLLENAIRHGVEARDGQGRVELRLQALERELRLIISNELPEGPASMPGHGLGLSATRERLHMLYGAAAGLDAGVQDGYYRVDLRMPLKELSLDDEPSPPYRPDR